MHFDALSKVFDKTQNLNAPMIKFRKLGVANLEKLFNFQHAALKSYVDVGFNQLKLASELTSVQDMPSFFRSQMEAAALVREKMMDDLKELTEMATTFRADFAKLTEENVSQLTPAPAPTTPKITGKAA